MKALRRAAAVLGLTAVIAVLILSGCGEAPDQVSPQTLAEAQALATGLGKPILLDFFTEW